MLAPPRPTPPSLAQGFEGAADGRVTLIGDVKRVSDKEVEADGLRALYKVLTTPLVSRTSRLHQPAPACTSLHRPAPACNPHSAQPAAEAPPATLAAQPVAPTRPACRPTRPACRPTPHVCQAKHPNAFWADFGDFTYFRMHDLKACVA